MFRKYSNIRVASTFRDILRRALCVSLCALHADRTCILTVNNLQRRSINNCQSQENHSPMDAAAVDR